MKNKYRKIKMLASNCPFKITYGLVSANDQDDPDGKDQEEPTCLSK